MRMVSSVWQTSRLFRRSKPLVIDSPRLPNTSRSLETAEGGQRLQLLRLSLPLRLW